MPCPDQSDPITIITERFDSLHACADRELIQAVIDKLGIAGAFTEEALAEIADHYVWTAAERERRTEAERPAIRAAAGLPPISEPRSDHSQSEAA